MNERLGRRSFLAMQAAAGRASRLRLGFVGVGDRGSYHLDVLLGMDSVEVKAICDIDEGYLYRGAEMGGGGGQAVARAVLAARPITCGCASRDDIDLVVTATPWQYHAPVCVAAMRAGKHAATEVPAALTLDECWELVETSEKTGKHCIMLEQANYSAERMAVLNMAQQGVFGEIAARRRRLRARPAAGEVRPRARAVALAALDRPQRQQLPDASHGPHRLVARTSTAATASSTWYR